MITRQDTGATSLTASPPTAQPGPLCRQAPGGPAHAGCPGSPREPGLGAALASPADSAVTSCRTSWVRLATAGWAIDAADDARAAWISPAAATSSAG